METRQIIELVQLVSSAHDISELEVECQGLRIRIVRAVPSAAPAAVLVRDAPPIHVERVQVAPAPVSPPVEKPEVVDESLYLMRSPVVGTFYRAASPSAEPYVKPGDRVKKGQVLCIVEAMKLMNEIESEVAGVIEAVVVEDGQPIEYGEPLFKIRQDK